MMGGGARAGGPLVYDYDYTGSREDGYQTRPLLCKPPAVHHSGVGFDPPPGGLVGQCGEPRVLGARVAAAMLRGDAEAAHLKLVPRPQGAGVAERHDV